MHLAASILERFWKRFRDWKRAGAVPFLHIFLVFLCTRVALFLLVGYTTLAVSPNQTLFEAVGSSLCNFDCSWFRTIAEGGYSTVSHSEQPWATNYAFFPL